MKPLGKLLHECDSLKTLNSYRKMGLTRMAYQNTIAIFIMTFMGGVMVMFFLEIPRSESTNTFLSIWFFISIAIACFSMHKRQKALSFFEHGFRFGEKQILWRDISYVSQGFEDSFFVHFFLQKIANRDAMKMRDHIRAFSLSCHLNNEKTIVLKHVSAYHEESDIDLFWHILYDKSINQS